MQPNDLVAIIKLSGGIGTLQQFTSNKKLLNSAAKKVRWNPSGNSGQGPFTSVNDSLVPISINGRTVPLRVIFGTIGNIIEGMKSLPGRKSVMLISDGYDVSPFQTLTLESEDRNTDVFDTEVGFMRRLIDVANRSSVVIYTMDARGLQTLGVGDARNSQAASLQGSQAGLVYIAKQTGGFAIINNNNLGEGIKKVLDDQSYYLIAYQPDEETFDPEKSRFNKLDIKVKRKNVKVRYRSGFLRTSDEENDKVSPQTPQEKLVTAVTSPFTSNEINLSLNALFASSINNKSFVRSFLHIDANDLKFLDEPNGNKKAVIDIFAVSFGENGVPAEKMSKTHTITVSPKRYETLLKEGLIYYFVFPMKKAGTYQMRVGLRDHATEKVGSANQLVEIPKLKEKFLTLSGIVLENLTYDQWKQRQTDLNKTFETTPILDTSLRQFKRGTVLQYGFEVYNAKISNAQKPQLSIRTRLFHNGKVVYEGKDRAVNTPQTSDYKIIKSAGALNLGSDMQQGEYILQLIVTDKLAKKKNQTTTQFIQFEIIG